jgi:hypothetical protein
VVGTVSSFIGFILAYLFRTRIGFPILSNLGHQIIILRDSDTEGNLKKSEIAIYLDSENVLMTKLGCTKEVTKVDYDEFIKNIKTNLQETLMRNCREPTAFILTESEKMFIRQALVTSHKILKPSKCCCCLDFFEELGPCTGFWYGLALLCCREDYEKDLEKRYVLRTFDDSSTNKEAELATPRSEYSSKKNEQNMPHFQCR